MLKHSSNLATNLNFDNVSSDIGDFYSSSLFEPDVVLPSQFHVDKNKGLVGGERRLMSALLSDGVQAYIEQAMSYLNGSRGRIDAIDWVESKDQSYIFSFDNVCFSLGINPEYLRLGLAKLLLESKQKRRQAKITDLDRKITGDKVISLLPNWKRIRRPRKS